MSWDYYLGHQNKATLVKEGDLKTTLGKVFEVSQIINDDEGWVKSFTLVEKGNPEEWEFTRQNEGYFWSGSTVSGIEELTRICNVVASKLNWKINNPQFDDQWNDSC